MNPQKTASHPSPQISRRQALTAVAGATLAVAGSRFGYCDDTLSNAPFVSKRPLVDQRRFTSPSVEETIAKVKADIADPQLAWLFENCYPNTLDTTVDYEEVSGQPDAFIITGDIDAMWLRDSTAQVWPYLPYMQTDKKLTQLVKGLIHRQNLCILRDPYANAFYKDLNQPSHWASDQPSPIPGVHERKWEIDSLCYAIRLAHAYFERTDDASIFDKEWQSSMKLVVKTFRTEQRKDGTTPYRFVRETTQMLDAPPFGGTGRPIKPVGLIASSFRPSDDCSLYSFLIPSNLFAVQSLRQLAVIFTDHVKDQEFAAECTELADEVQAAIEKHAVLEHLDYGEIYAYEVDGFGNAAFWDDANVPSLMSLAYLGIHQPRDPLYQRTRKFLLSKDNPYYLEGSAASGQASPHTGKDAIWPMGIILRALSSTSEDEILECVTMLRSTHAGTGFMHESFNKDDPTNFSREWFAWANTLFGELIVMVHDQYPDMLSHKFSD